MDLWDAGAFFLSFHCACIPLIPNIRFMGPRRLEGERRTLKVFVLGGGGKAGGGVDEERAEDSSVG